MLSYTHISLILKRVPSIQPCSVPAFGKYVKSLISRSPQFAGAVKDHRFCRTRYFPAQFTNPTASVCWPPPMNGRRAVVFAHRRHQPGCAEQVAILNDLRAPSAKRIAAPGGVKMNKRRSCALRRRTRDGSKNEAYVVQQTTVKQPAPLMKTGIHHSRLTDARDPRITCGEAASVLNRP